MGYSKLQSEALREAITVVRSKSDEKKRNFVETLELQIGLKNYDPQKDKRFSGSVKLPHIPRPKMKICMLGDAQHVEEVINLFTSPNNWIQTRIIVAGNGSSFMISFLYEMCLFHMEVQIV